MVSAKSLIFTNDSFTKNKEQWDLLYKLVVNEIEESDKEKLISIPQGTQSKVINQRLASAPYLSVMGMVLSKLVSHVVSGKGDFKGINVLTGQPDKDEFWQDFFNTRAFTPQQKQRVSFDQFLTESLFYALIFGTAIAVIDTPRSNEIPLNKQQQEAMGLNKPYVTLFKRQNLLDYQYDDEGNLVFVKIYTCSIERNSWQEPYTPCHLFHVYEMIEGQCFQSKYKVTPKQKDNRFSFQDIDDNSSIIEALIENEPVFYLTEGDKIISKIPVVFLSIPKPLDLARQLKDSQISHFRVGASAEYAMLSTNYAQLIIMGSDGEEETKRRITAVGDGFFWVLKGNEDAKWLERQGTAIDRSLKYKEEKKQEMFDIISQVASNAVSIASKTQQSGESKKEDRRQMDILLSVYGEYLKNYIKQILDVASIARGTLLEWQVSGFDNYDSDSFMTDLEEYLGLTDAVDSPTLKAEGQKAIARHAVKELGINPDLLPQIYQEIEEGVKFDDALEPEILNQPDDTVLS